MGYWRLIIQGSDIGHHTSEQANKVPVLHLSWLYDTFEMKLLQPDDKYRLAVAAPEQEQEQEQEKKLLTTHDTAGFAHYHEPTDANSDTEEESVSVGINGEGFGSREGSPEYEDSRLITIPSPDHGPEWQNVEYACLRPSPLKSKFNQILVDELEILRLQRIQSGNQEMNATAYGRAISAVKALPFTLATNPSRARNIKGIGPKIAKLIYQFYEQGHIAEAELIRNDHGFQTMSQFMELYGVGPKRAREYYSQGARTLDDVIRLGGSLGTHLHIQECLRILPDLRCKIPRREVLEIAQLVSR